MSRATNNSSPASDAKYLGSVKEDESGLFAADEEAEVGFKSPLACGPLKRQVIKAPFERCKSVILLNGASVTKSQLKTKKSP